MSFFNKMLISYSFSRYFSFIFLDECTYLFNVISTVACPNISLNDFISIPTSIQFVAKVCLKT